MQLDLTHDWINYVLLDLISYADANNLNETAGKIAEVYNFLQLKKEDDKTPPPSFVDNSAVVIDFPPKAREKKMKIWESALKT